MAERRTVAVGGVVAWINTWIEPQHANAAKVALIEFAHTYRGDTRIKAQTATLPAERRALDQIVKLAASLIDRLGGNAFPAFAEAAIVERHPRHANLRGELAANLTLFTALVREQLGQLPARAKGGRKPERARDRLIAAVAETYRRYRRPKQLGQAAPTEAAVRNFLQDVMQLRDVSDLRSLLSGTTPQAKAACARLDMLARRGGKAPP